MKPLIGITLEIKTDNHNLHYYEQHCGYAQMISQAGGIPFPITLETDIEWLQQNLNGLLIPGGLDIHPENYGEKPATELKLQNPLRFEFEKKLIQALPTTIPILGICYGSQCLNVIYGGTLTQHIPDILGHEEHQSRTIQNYKVALNSKLYHIIQSQTTSGHSFHHQAIQKIAPNFIMSAHSEDGIVEAIESTEERWILGLQWHPERTRENDDSPKIFTAFIEASKKNKLKNSVF